MQNGLKAQKQANNRGDMATFEKIHDASGELRHRARVRMAGFAPKSATFSTRREAQEWAAATETMQRRARYGLQSLAEQMPMAQAIARYIKTVLPKKSRKAAYVAQQRAQLQWWARELKPYTVAQTTSAVIVEKRDMLALEFTNATTNRYTAALSHVFTVMVREWEMLPASPFAKLKKLKEGKGRNRFLSDDERKALLAACAADQTRKPLLTIVTLAICTGARKGELLGLKWRDVDFKRGRLVAHDTKNGDQRTLFLSGYALELLLALYAIKHPRSAYVFARRCGRKPIEIDREFTRALDRAGIEDFHFHDLRHTAASYMAMNGKAATDIKAALGHRSVAMVDRYAHLADTHMADVMQDWTSKVFPPGEVRA